MANPFTWTPDGSGREDGWQISEIQIYVGYDDVNPLPATKKGNVIPGKFPYKKEYDNPVETHKLTMDLKEDLGFSWGANFKELRTPTLAVHADLVQLNDKGKVIAEEGAWTFGSEEFEGSQWSWTFTYLLAHPMRGQFIDSPVQGLSCRGPTQQGITGYDEDGLESEQGGFFVFPGRSHGLFHRLGEAGHSHGHQEGLTAGFVPGCRY